MQTKRITRHTCALSSDDRASLLAHTHGHNHEHNNHQHNREHKSPRRPASIFEDSSLEA